MGLFWTEGKRGQSVGKSIGEQIVTYDMQSTTCVCVYLRRMMSSDPIALWNESN